MKFRLPRKLARTVEAAGAREKPQFHGPLYFIGGVIGLALVAQLCQFFKVPGADYLKLVAIVLILCCICYFLFSSLMTAIFTIAQPQKHLSELMATVLFGASVLTVITSSVVVTQDNIVRFGMLAFGWALSGSMWAWDRMKLLGISDSRARFIILFKGWLAVPGTLAAVALLFFMLAALLLLVCGYADTGDMKSCLTGISICLLLSALALPALNVERALRRRISNSKF
jgi:hypothetical protein